MAESNSADLTKENEWPLVTFALFAYNQASYIAAAVKGALEQDYEPMEIILSDDFSTDETYTIMKELADSYRGSHTVRIRQNTKNLGLATHFSNVIEEAKGDYIVVAAGDDVSLPSRTAEVIRVFTRNPNYTFIDVSAVEIDSDGKEISADSNFEPGELNLKDFLKRRPNGLSGAARAYRKSSLTLFPKLNPKCPTEDTTSALRCLLIGNGLLMDQKLILRRHHDRNLSGSKSMKSMSMNEILLQYLADIDFCRKLGQVDKKTTDILTRWANREIAKRKLLQDISNNEITFFELMGRVFVGAKTDWVTKLILAKCYLLSVFKQIKNK